MASTVPGFNLLHLDSSTRPAELNVRSLDALVAGNGIQSCLALSWRVTWRQRFGVIKQVTLLCRPSYCNLIKEPNKIWKIDIPKYLILAIGNTWIFFYFFFFNDPPQPAPQIKWQFLDPPQPAPRVTRGVRGLWDDPRITSTYINIIKRARVHVFNPCFSATQWTFLFETAAKRAVRYVKRCRTDSAQRYVFLWDQVVFKRVLGQHTLIASTIDCYEYYEPIRTQFRSDSLQILN